MKKVSETDIERWTSLVEKERKHVYYLIVRASTYGTKEYQRAREDATQHDQLLTETLATFRNPIVQIRDHISIIHDRFNGKAYLA